MCITNTTVCIYFTHFQTHICTFDDFDITEKPELDVASSLRSQGGRSTPGKRFCLLNLDIRKLAKKVIKKIHI